MQPERGESRPRVDRLVRLGLGALVAGGFVMVLILLHPEVRAWVRHTLYLPVVAAVLGRDTILSSGVAIAAGPAPYVTLAIAVAYAITLLLIRSLLFQYGGHAGRDIATRVRIDSSLALAVLPFIAMAATVEALAATRLFQHPWAFLAVPPMVVHLTVGILVLSLVLALWTESGGPRHHRARFLAATLLFLVIGLFWTAVVQGTTKRLPWWLPLAAILVTLAVYHSVTLAGRLVSHRRALFSLGVLQLFFFAGFFVVWFVEGPWPVLAWTYEGQGALRETHSTHARDLVLMLGVPLLVAVGAYTIGSFLHRYTPLAQVWVDGLSVVALFAQTLDAWAVTLAAHDPYGSFGRTEAPVGPIAAWAVNSMGGWGYLWLKLVTVILIVTLLSGAKWSRTARGAEIHTLILGAIAAFGLASGLRVALTLAAGV